MDLIKERDKILASFGESFHFTVCPPVEGYRREYYRLFSNRKSVIGIYRAREFGNVFSLVTLDGERSISLVMVFAPVEKNGAPVMIITLINGHNKTKAYVEYFASENDWFPDEEFLRIQERYGYIRNIRGSSSWEIPERMSCSLFKQTAEQLDMDMMLVKISYVYGREVRKWWNSESDFVRTLNLKMKTTRNLVYDMIARTIGSRKADDFIDRHVLPVIWEADTNEQDKGKKL